VACPAKGEIDVLVARGQHLDSFTENGDLISTTVVPESFILPSRAEQSVTVPTSLLLWVFSSPFLSWGVMVIGSLGLASVRKFARRKGD
jgi:hypothetical protein